MKSIRTLMLVCLTIISCNVIEQDRYEILDECVEDPKEWMTMSAREELDNGGKIVDPGILTDNVILGRKIDNPYSIQSMQEAYKRLRPTTKLVGDSLLTPNYAYIRFLPVDAEDLSYLCDSMLELYNYPLDYEILGDPTDYFDESVGDNPITWQYTVIPINDVIPPVHHEILDECYIPGDPGYNEFNDQLEEEAFGGVGVPVYSGHSGKIMVDTGDTLVPVKGVKIRARSFLKIRTCYTDENGNYDFDYSQFHYFPRKEIRWEGSYGYTLGEGIKLCMPQSSDLSQANLTITRAACPTEWALSAVNNALYDWYRECNRSLLPSPPNDLRVWVWKNMLDSSAIESGMTAMLHHINIFDINISDIETVLNSTDTDSNIGQRAVAGLVNLILPDIIVFGAANANVAYSNLYSCAIHEAAHASHFQNVGTTRSERSQWWCQVINYELNNIIQTLFSTQNPYGTAETEGSGPCGLTEMWAYAADAIFQAKSPANSSYWFSPAPLCRLHNDYETVFTLRSYASLLTRETTSIQQFMNKLILYHPYYEEEIRAAFSH